MTLVCKLPYADVSTSKVLFDIINLEQYRSIIAIDLEANDLINWEK